MTINQQIIIIALMALMVIISRALPFIVFSSGHETPPYIKYLGKVLPLAVFGMLVVYCLKDIDWIGSEKHGIPEIIGIIATILAHIWKRQLMVSIAVGTIVYMIIIRCL